MTNKKLWKITTVVLMTIAVSSIFAVSLFQAQSSLRAKKFLTLKSFDYSFYATPNPFEDFTIITVNASEPIDASITIKDLEGNPLRLLFEGTFQTGINNFIWDGTDEHGERLKKGKYVAELFNKKNYTSKTIILILK